MKVVEIFEYVKIIYSCAIRAAKHLACVIMRPEFYASCTGTQVAIVCALEDC